MTSQALSEALFEQFCERHDILCSHVATGADPSPDFMIELAGLQIACEVKHIDLNTEDRDELKGVCSGGSPGVFCATGSATS